MKTSFNDLSVTIRSIHQVLILTGFALIITVLLSKPLDDISAAQNELAIIEILTNVDTWNPLFLEEFYGVDDDLSLGIGDDVTHFLSWEIEFFAQELSLFNEPLGWNHITTISAPIDIFEGWEYSFFQFYGAEPYVNPPKTIEELSQIWNRARDVSILEVTSLKDYAYVQRAFTFPVEKVDITILDSEEFFTRDDLSNDYGVFRSNIFQSDDVAIDDRSLYGLSYIVEDFLFQGHTWKIWIPAITGLGYRHSTEIGQPFDATEILCERGNIERSLCVGPFEQVFPNLYVTVKEYWNLPYQNIENILVRQQESLLINFDFLGMKIPTRMVSTIGSVILLTMQLYFLLHLHTLRKASNSDIIPAWIGTFPDWISRSLALLLGSFFPLLSINVVSLIIPSEPSPWANATRIFLYSSACFSIWIITEFVFLWRLIDKPDRGLQAKRKKRLVKIMKK